ncbi:uncharacterized protein LINC02618 [Monodelphis domestica]|uniref:uncharacterized protein LINC02618 n=1 Tax=Monodelphis domestica TaxID=13616 RepID=UPI0024E1CB52|nr:uncharacterized protein LINC02618 [Monodelphis domestica]
MPRTKKEKSKLKGASSSFVPILTKFLKTYEKHCLQSQTSVCPTIKKALKTSIENKQILRKLMLVSPAVSPKNFPEVSLEPLLKTIRDERYMLGRELCIWGMKLKNSDVASLAILLELRGRTMYPFSTLEIINSQMDLWSIERLGKCLLSSNLLSIILDYNKFGNEEVDILMAGLEKNQKLMILSLRYCNLGPTSGSKLGQAVSQSAICELYLSGNYLQCSGALALIEPIAEFAENQGKDKATKLLQDRRSPSQQMLQGKLEVEEHLVTRAQTFQHGNDCLQKTLIFLTGFKKNKKASSEIGPWLIKLHLDDNGIDGRGKEGEGGVLEFTQLVTYLIKYSGHLREIDLGNNVLGEIAATNILEALKERKKAKLPNLHIIVTPQISSDTFRSIWKNNRNSGSVQKKKKVSN